jgi:hypothetical protein
MKVILTQKLADKLDGIDLARFRVGDVVDVSQSEAGLLVAEGWAMFDRRVRSRPVRCGAVERRRRD